MSNWRIFRGLGEPASDDPISRLPAPPPWRDFTDPDRDRRRGTAYRTNTAAADQTLDLINAALYLRRPLLVTGKPGTGKSTLAYAIAEELGLGRLLKWPINTRTTIQDGLYRYDALARLRDTQSPLGAPPSSLSAAEQIGRYIRLGPLGTALLPAARPRVLLIDEIDKGDVDLPNDLLHVFEEGEFSIPEITRLLPDQSASDQPGQVVPITVQSDEDRPVTIPGGWVRCTTFPIVVMTSNGERDFPPAFLRRCVRLDIHQPKTADLLRIVEAHLGEEFDTARQQIELHIRAFLAEQERARGDLATDQLLNLIYLLLKAPGLPDEAEQALRKELLRALSS